MRIHSLEITGFKSFGDRIVLSFERGISAIVGPNGCGKSNVVDAVRWVMGEQNPRTLRGRAMEDVIFSGTESRPSVGLAEVVLTLDGSEGTIPPPYSGFSEIQIARRLYRSGESEYLINRVPTRLRDVLDFFLDTGLGTRGYTIVEQGKIAELVSTKPEERRVIFEEAAGIGKYRLRRRETERKLLATEQNLVRLTDILGELRRQISSLDRQARKARRYRELSSRVRDLELAVTWQELQGDEARVREAERELETARAASLALDARVGRAEAALQSERRAHLDREREIQQRGERLFSLRSEIQALENRIAYERRESEDLERLAEDRAREIAELEQQARGHAVAHQETLRSLAEVEARLEADARELAERESRLALESDRLAELQGLREALQVRLVRLASEGATLESRAEALDERRRELEVRLRQSEESFEQNARQAEERSSEETGLDGKVRGALAERDQLGRSLAELLRVHSEARSDLEAGQAQAARSREELREEQGRLDALEDAEKRDSSRSARALGALSEVERRLVRGMLSEVIQVQDGLEAALEAVLGPRLEAFLVEDGRAALELLAALRREKAGRATALLLGAGPPAPRSGIVPIGRPLLDFVSVSERHRPLVDRLLREVLVVDDLGEVVERFGVLDPPATFVTGRGELLDRSGALTGGSGAPAGALSRQTEIRRLRDAVERAGGHSAELERVEVERAARLDERERELDNARSRLHSAELAVVNLEKDLERARERSKTALLAVEEVRAAKEELLGERERIVREREVTLERLEAIAREHREAEGRREALGGEAGELGREVERVEQRLVQARVELAGLGARRDQLRDARQRLETQLGEARDWADRRRQEVARARERSGSLQRSVGEGEERLAGLIRDEEELRRAQEAERERYEEVTRRVETLEQETRAASREREGTRERVGAAELALQELRMRRDQVCERILERYDVDLRRYQPGPEQLEGTPEGRSDELLRLRQSLQSLGEVHLGAIEEYEEVSERHRYLSEQKADLEESIRKLKNAIARINRTSRQRFRDTFQQIDGEFRRMFPRMFRGGRAHLSLTEAEDVLEAGIEISAQPPGKKLQNVNLLSGGEKAMTAIALLFAVFKIRPSPFFLLDEVDAALDDANVGRFDELLRELAENSQFLVITHNKASIESADTLYGITMEDPGLSKLVTVDLVS